MSKLITENDDVFDVIPRDEETETFTEADKAARDLSDAMSEQGAGSTVTVYRQEGGGKEPMQYVEEAPADAYTLSQWMSRLQREYGGGWYRFHLRSNGKLKQNKLVKIAEKLAKTNMPVIPGDTETSKVLQAILAMQERQTNMLAEVMKPKDTMIELQRMLTMMSAMREAFGMRDEKPVYDASESMKKMMDNVSGMMELQLKMLDFKQSMQEISAPEAKEEGVMDVIKQFAPQVIEVVKAKQTLEAARTQNETAHTTAALRMQAPAVVEPTRSRDELGEQVAALLLPYAERNDDIEAVANQVIALAGAPAITTFLNEERPLARLMRASKPIRRHVDWLADLVACLDDLLNVSKTAIVATGEEVTHDADSNDDGITGGG